MYPPRVLHRTCPNQIRVLSQPLLLLPPPPPPLLPLPLQQREET